MTAWRALIAAADDADTLTILGAGMLAEGVLNDGDLAERARNRAAEFVRRLAA